MKHFGLRRPMKPLNYFQEALKLYIRRYGDINDPEKLTTFEKKIALALFNKGNFASAIEYFDKTLTRWGVRSPRFKFSIGLKLIYDAIIVLAHLYLPFIKGSKLPTERDNEYFNLNFKRNIALVHTDNIRAFTECFGVLKKSCSFDLPSLLIGAQMWVTMGAHVAFSGTSFKLSNKFLEYGQNLLDQDNIRDLVSYRSMKTFCRLCSGAWDEIGEYDDHSVDLSLRKGDLHMSCTYLLGCGLIKAEQGNFRELESLTIRLFEISETYGYETARIYSYVLKIDSLIKKNKLYEPVTEAESAFSLAVRTGMDLNQIQFMAYKTISQVMLNEINQAETSIKCTEDLIAKQSFVPPIYITPHFIGQISLNIIKLIQAIESNNKFEIKNIRKKTYNSCRAALKISHKYVPCRTKVLKLMGKYYWLIGKQAKALKWWGKAIQEGERLGARPDLSRTFFEVGKRLMEPHCKYKKLNGKNAEEYLEKARAMFQEMDLQWDLDELDKISNSEPNS